MLFTSGSTGRPKGVAVTHRALVNYLAWCGDTYGVEPGDTSLVHSPLGFDLTVTGLLAPLTAGASLMAPPGTSLSDKCRYVAIEAPN